MAGPRARSLTGLAHERPTLTAAGVQSMVPAVERWLAFRAAATRVPGMQAAVLYDGEIVLSTAWGLADVDAGTAMTTDHLFRIASHSKTFTATAIMQLFEQHKLRLDDRVDHWLPDLAGTPGIGDDETIGSLTIRDLLAHNGGVFRDGEEADFWQTARPFPDEAELRRVLAADARVLPADERFKYSNIGFGVLGLIVAAASGQSYHDLVQSCIVGRLSLDHTGPEYDPHRADEYVTGYTALCFGERRPIPPIDTGALASATGFYSTAEDVCRYAAAHFFGDTRLLSDASKRQMQRVAWEVGPGEDQYGLGFKIAKVDKRRMVGHGGGFPGQITSTLFDPVERLAVSVLTNAIDGPAQELLYGIVRLLDMAAGDKVLDHDTAARFTGRFAALWSVVDIVAAGDKLVALYPAMPDPTMGKTTFEIVDDQTLQAVSAAGYGSRGELWHFRHAEDGSIESVRSGGGQTMRPFGDYGDPLP